jgi:hypothetical protein
MESGVGKCLAKSSVAQEDSFPDLSAFVRNLQLSVQCFPILRNTEHILWYVCIMWVDLTGQLDEAQLRLLTAQWQCMHRSPKPEALQTSTKTAHLSK